MAWLAVDRDDTEVIYEACPIRVKPYGFWHNGAKNNHDSTFHFVDLPEGTIKKLIGRDLTWDDEPVELK